MELPIFPCFPYMIQDVTTLNTFSIYYEKFLPYQKSDKFFICELCILNGQPKCKNCVEFSRYPKSFLIYNKIAAFWIPQPVILARRNLSYLRSFIDNMSNLKIDLKYTIPQQLDYRYRKFKDCSFKGK